MLITASSQILKFNKIIMKFLKKDLLIKFKTTMIQLMNNVIK